jgi:stearoyl-CoA desaturase (Delta-9 desaturase)
MRGVAAPPVLTVGGLSLTERAFNVMAVTLPFAGFALAIALSWNELVGWTDLAILGVMYVATVLGVAMGFHRLLVHRSFETHPFIRNTLAVLGSMAVEGPPISWVADHRKHHTFADEDGDPHSPHTHGGPGIRGQLRGLWHAHAGWLVDGHKASDPIRYAKDLLRDPAMRRISTLFLPIVGLGLLIPFVLGLVLTGSLAGGLTALLWGGFVRIFVVHHITWSVNSLGHWAGRRRFATHDRSTNVALLALPSFGDAWHHNHHAFPTSARHGLRWWEIDLIGMLIWVMEKLGLAWDVVRVSPEQMRRKEPAAVA